VIKEIYDQCYIEIINFPQLELVQYNLEMHEEINYVLIITTFFTAY